jgi:hypothetical protein
MKKRVFILILLLLASVIRVPGVVYSMHIPKESLQTMATTPSQPVAVKQNLIWIDNPSEEPNPPSQPLAAKVTDGHLVLNARFPTYEGPVWIMLAFFTPNSDLHFIKSDNTVGEWSGTSSWREGVTGEQVLQGLSIPVNQTQTGIYFFYSLVATDPAISNYDVTAFTLDIQIQPTPSLAEIRGRIFDSMTGEPIQGATISLEPGSVSLTSVADGTFSSSSIAAGTYTVQISAANYNTKSLSGIAIAMSASNQLDVSLNPYTPQVTSAAANPTTITNDGQGKTLLMVRITHPLSLASISSVMGDLSAIGGSAQQVFYDDATHGDITAWDGTYTFQSTVKPGTRAKLYSLNVTAFDQAENQGFGSISLNVIDKVSGVVQPTQPDSKTFDNPLGGQTLNIHYALLKTVLSLRGIRSDCEVQLTVLGPNGEHYGPYSVTDSIDVSIPNAAAGQWEYETINQCATAQSYEIETSGSGTGLLVGRVTDGLTGVGVKGAAINCNTGGSTVSLDQGYYSGVAVAGTGIVTTAKTGFQTNIRSGVHVKAGSTTSLNIQVVPQGAPAQATPSGASVFHILDPAEDPKPPTQPVAAKVSGSSLELNAIFPRYQQAVDLYLGFTPNSGEHAGKLFLIDENNSFVEFTGSLHAWRTHSTKEESGQIPIPADFAYGVYTLYSLVTTDSSSLTNFVLNYFTTTPPMQAPVAQNITFISKPAEDPDPLSQPMAAKVIDGYLVLDTHFPLQAQPVTIFLAYSTPGGALYLIRNDNSPELFSGVLSSWRENVTAEQRLQGLSISTNQIQPGTYTFYSLVSTDPAALSNYDLVFFNLDVQNQ